MTDAIYTVEQVAEKLCTNTQTVYRLLQGKELVGYKKLAKWYVLHSDLLAYITKQ